MSDFPNLQGYPYLGYDTETTGLVFPRDRAFAFSLAAPDGHTWYYDIRRTPKAVDWLNDQMAEYRGRIICHNASFDYRMSYVSGIRLPIDALDDTGIRACLLDEHLVSYELDVLGARYCGIRKDTTVYERLAGLFGGPTTRRAQIHRLRDAPIDVVGPYAEQDALVAVRLWEWQEQEILRQNDEYPAAPITNVLEFERRLMPNVIRREMHGIRVDTDYAEQAADMLVPHIMRAQDRLNELCGWEVNVNSGPQIKKIFEPKYRDGEWWVGDTMVGTTKTGNPSLGAAYLREINDERANLILGIRSDIKTRDTFLLGHVVGHAVGGRVYPNINQIKGEDGGTGTGRFSYTAPALQQIPSRDKAKAAIVKPCFLPDSDEEDWYDLDLDTFEFRVFAHLVNNARMVAAYKKDPSIDFHQYVATITGLVRNATYPGQANSKQLNLSMVFNQGDGATAEKMGMEWAWDTFIAQDGKKVTYKKAGDEARRIIDMYHAKVPGVKELAKKCRALAENRGFVRTFRGRRLRFPHGWKSYKASGLLIQGTSADLNKENWERVDEALDGQGRMLLNTHDSYGLSLPKDRRAAQSIIRDVRAAIEEPGRIRIPLLCDVAGPGTNWWDAIK